MRKQQISKPKIEVMLDSGAFSAWMRGEKVNLKKYIKYVQEHKDLLHSYVNLDVIPGSFAKKRTQDEVEKSAKASYDNQQTMKSHGLKPVPVFHQGESLSWLERMLNDGEEYIGISPYKDVTQRQKMVWLDRIFSLLTDASGRPYIKVHGMGTTTPLFMLRYPWYTVDSTTWSLRAGYGQIMVPKEREGKFDYLTTPQWAIMSGVQQSSSAGARRQYEAMGEAMQSHVRRFIEEECATTITAVRNSASERRRCFLIYYMRLAEALQDVRFDRSSVGNTLTDSGFTRKPVSFDKFRLMFATMVGSRQFSDILNACGATTRLVSYWESRKYERSVFEEYVTEGQTRGDYEPTIQKQKWNSEAYESFRRMRLWQRSEEVEGEENRSTKGA